MGGYEHEILQVSDLMHQFEQDANARNPVDEPDEPIAHFRHLKSAAPHLTPHVAVCLSAIYCYWRVGRKLTNVIAIYPGWFPWSLAK